MSPRLVWALLTQLRPHVEGVACGSALALGRRVGRRRPPPKDRSANAQDGAWGLGAPKTAQGPRGRRRGRLLRACGVPCLCGGGGSLEPRGRARSRHRGHRALRRQPQARLQPHPLVKVAIEDFHQPISASICEATREVRAHKLGTGHTQGATSSARHEEVRQYPLGEGEQVRARGVGTGSGSIGMSGADFEAGRSHVATQIFAALLHEQLAVVHRHPLGDALALLVLVRLQPAPYLLRTDWL